MSQRPGRRAAPKPSRFGGFKVTRHGKPPAGRRIAGPGDTTTSIPVVQEPLLGTEPASVASSAPQVDPLDRPLLDADPFGIRAALIGSPGVPPVVPAPAAPVVPPVVPPAVAPVMPEAVLPPGAPVVNHVSQDAVVGAVLPVAEPVVDLAPAPLDLPPAPDPDFRAPEGYVVDPPMPTAVEEESPEVARAHRREALTRVFFWGCVCLTGIILLAAAALHRGPEWLDGAGAVCVIATYAWAVMARTGGRQVVFSALAVAIGVTAVVSDVEVLRSGAAVLTCVVSGLLAVVITVPARTFPAAVREVVVATAVASVGAFATVGFEPVASTTRFGYVTLAVGFLLMFALVWRFAAGLHGLGTRGLVIVVVGTLVLAVSLVYTELLRSYAGNGMASGSELSEWLRSTIGAVPRPLTIFLGVPALVWGVHMRARRRQGWWVCAFGAAATLPVAQRLVNLDTSYVEAGLQTAYSVALGLVVGYLIIRLDLAFTGQRGARARAAEEAHAVRPEPPRFSSL
ncbi:hypothetical protein [Nocardioides jishulii]|uniref:DUF2339 domain-containing protein n=1 Tax=Nocardioides jishulii TaxID=2575440 RepID=A0A4U2YU02_9ACTN|nr:hypothetical protein [Nocardioides jishulii]QCX28910.1 hypothetical protein FCL41_16305 [Nocardioides jishulii]TKI64192.1 hypothetical protein FC770_03260 [Nocardioides jishulii]